MDKLALGVCGGGTTGLLLSINLAKLGHKIHLFADKINTQPSPMAHAVNPLTEQLLRNAGIWDQLEKNPFYNMRVENFDNQFNFNCNEANAPYLGHIIAINQIIEHLYQACQQHPNIQIHLTQLAKTITQDKSQVIIHSNDQEYYLKWLFAADGADSWVRKQMPVEWIIQPGKEQCAIVASVTLKQSLNNTAWQNLTNYGPIALLPQKDQAALIWSTNQHHELMQLDDISFCNKVNQYSPYAIDKIVAKRLCRPIKTQYAKKFYYKRCIFIGDAAHTVLPLFGQGANLASLDIKYIIELLEQSNLGHLYHKKRYMDNLLFSKFSHYFDNYATNQKVLKIGNQLIRNSFIKKHLIKYALGIRDQNFNLWPSY